MRRLASDGLADQPHRAAEVADDGACGNGLRQSRLRAAAGLPLITFIASRYGWRVAYGAIGALGLVSLWLLVWRLPRGLKGVAVDLKTWGKLARNRMVVLLLLLLLLTMTFRCPASSWCSPSSARFGPD